MKPSSLLGISLELIELVAEPGGLPADARVGRFFRHKRFLGSRDRRILGNAVYAWLRHGLQAKARLQSFSEDARFGPLRALGRLGNRYSFLPDVLWLARDGLFPLSLDETLEAARGLEPPSQVEGLAEMPWSIEPCGPTDPVARFAIDVSLPIWLARRLVKERGEEEAGRLARSLLKPGTVDLRVNLRLVDRETARTRLSDELGQEVAPTSWSPLGLRLPRRTNLGGTSPSREGWIEVEDEGSQIMVLSTDCKAGMTVLDACAGAGGKTLAFADLLFRKTAEPPQRESELVACDVDPNRLRELSRRSHRANVTNHIQVVRLKREGPLPRDLPSADLVLVDAPCSGTGTLRRNPDLKLRYGEKDISAFAHQQRGLLARFAPCVKPGGRLAYVTCSPLREENEEVALAFSGAHPEFEESPSSWAMKHLPPACLQGSWITIDPVKTGTDGFFMATWRRAKDIVSREFE